MSIIKGVWVMIMCLLGTFTASAQSFTARADKNKVAVGETFELSYTYAGKWQGFLPPDLKDLELLSPPSRSFSTSIINGTVKIESTYSFYVMAKQPGTITIGPAKVRTDKGKTVPSNPLTITVTRESTAATDPIADLLLVAELNKKDVVVGEAIMLTYKLYYRNVDLRAVNPAKVPSLEGFWAEDVKLPDYEDNRVVDLNGERYMMVTRRQVVLFPQKSGELTIEPMEMECIGAIEDKNGPDDPFFRNLPIDPFRHFKEFRRRVSSKEVAIRVRPVPAAGKPRHYSGMVGNATLSAQADKDSLAAGDALTFTLTLGGEGNITLVEPFDIQIDNAEVFKPETQDDVQAAHGTLSGLRTFAYTIIPQKEGLLQIPSVDFSYYDPVKKEYKQVQTRPIEVKVGPPNKPLAADTYANGKGPLPDGLLFEVAPKVWWALGIALVVGLGTYIFILMLRTGRGNTLQEKVEIVDYNAYKLENTAIGQYKEAPVDEDTDRLMREKITSAAENIEGNKFFGYLLEALHYYQEGITGLGRAEASEVKVRLRLIQEGKTQAEVEEYFTLRSGAEIARYSPAGTGISREELLARTRSLLLDA